MRDACIRSVESAIGRQITQTEARNIEGRIRNAMTQLARQDPAGWRAKSDPEKLSEAGKFAGQELVNAASLAKQRLGQQVIASQRGNTDMDDQIGSGRDTNRMTAVERKVRTFADGRSNGAAADASANGNFAVSIAQIQEVLRAGKHGPLWAHIPFSDPRMNKVVREILNGRTQGHPPELVKAVDMAREHIDALTEEFRAKGGLLGHLEDYKESQIWSARLLYNAMRRAGNGDAQAGRSAIVKRFADAAETRRYIHPDGKPYTQAEIEAFMDNALQSILTDGANKSDGTELRGGGPSMEANRYRHHRQIHLRSDVAPEMLNEFSEVPAMASLVQQIHRLTRSIALLDEFGPNARAEVERRIERAIKTEQEGRTLKESDVARLRAKGEDILGYYDHLAGNIPRPKDLATAATFATARSFLTFIGLGKALLSSIAGDLVNQHASLLYYQLPVFKYWVELVKAQAGFGRRWARRAGLLTDTLTGYADRFSYDHITARDFGSRAASFTLKATGLNWWTEASRQAYAAVMYDTIGHLVRHHKTFASLKNANDVALLRILNVDEPTWAVWRQAKRETSTGAGKGGLSMLTPSAIMDIPEAQVPYRERLQAAQRLAAVLYSELHNAIITPDVKERANFRGKDPSGSMRGEIMTSIQQWKMFPWAQMTKHFERAMGFQRVDPQTGQVMRDPTTGRPLANYGVRLTYGAAIVIALWLSGIVSDWLHDLDEGRDFRPVNPFDPDPDRAAAAGRNLFSAFARGGGAGIYSDLVSPDIASGLPNSFSSSLSGPLAGRLEDVHQLTLGNLQQAALGQDPEWGPDTVRFGRSLTPNWWYSKAIVDRAVWNQLIEMTDPGYIDRVRRRGERVYGSEYWWSPEANPWEGEGPERAPEFVQ